MNQPQDQQLEQTVMREAMDDFDRFEFFFTSRWQQLILLGVIAIILVGVGAWGFKAHQASQSRAASELGVAVTPEQLREVLARHGGHKAAGHARLRLVKLLFEAGQSAEALTEVQALIATNPTIPEVRWQALLNQGYLLESLGRNEEAAESFAAVGLDLVFPEFVRDEANVNAAQLFLRILDKPERAKGCLQAVGMNKLYQDPSFIWAEKARELLRQLP